MTADQLKDIIAAGLACDHITLEGDGRLWWSDEFGFTGYYDRSNP